MNGTTPIKNAGKLITSSSNTVTENTMNNITDSIKDTIRHNNYIVDDVNQLLHNEGIEFNSRLEIIINMIRYKFNNETFSVNTNDAVKTKVIELFDKIVLDKNELLQRIFMFYCNKKTKINLDQFYTPITIGSFISNMIISNKNIIDPACGTGDLIVCYDGNLTAWDVSPDAVEVCEYNYTLNEKKYEMDCVNSIKDTSKSNNTFDYCAINPPFGSSTVITDREILDKYELGKNKKKEEIGILFIERAMKLLKDDGIAFIILPNGYLGNSSKNTSELRSYLLRYRIISILELPCNTFSRSGTGVSTSLLIVQKKKMESNYNIFIKKIENIGYVLNKKNTPYKYKTVNGNYMIKDNKPILDNDFNDCCNELKSFINTEKIDNFDNNYECADYEIVNTSELESNILDINRYLSRYKSIVSNYRITNKKAISNYIEKANGKFVIVSDKEYLYLDIKQITSPMYNRTNTLYGYELPGRAKIQLQKHDIIVSKLKGKISFTIILDDADNIICTNGFALLRPKNYKNAVILFANLFTNEFKIQHNALCTGSIMETISDLEIKKIYINEDIDFKKYETIINALSVINNEL